ncbi:MAG: glycosyl transferase, family 2 [Bryobacterales bacterium]|nr:glycosyl transferase, family 2 [Bryobacterales bacterium]
MTTSIDSLAAIQPAPAELAWEPLPALRPVLGQDDSELADCHGKRIGILIVTYNAVSTLAKVLHRITPNVWKNVEEIAVFDDASQDATYDLAVGMKTLWLLPKLRVLKHSRNLGYGGNQKAGFRYFMDKGFDVVILLHGDGQYAPEILSHLYHPIVAGQADAVFGSRMLSVYGGPLRGGMPFYKYVGNRILSTIENRALGMHLSEFHSGYRAYSLDALRHIDLTAMTDDFHFDTEIIIKLHHQHYSIREVPIPTYYGSEICRVNGLRYAGNVVRAVWRYLQTCRSVARHSEFQEYFLHYPLKLSPYSSHHYARRMTGSGNDVLDVGCGEGFFAAELNEDGNRVTGIDNLSRPEREDALDEYLKCDLDRGIAPLVPHLGGKRFDRILFLDVLEHLRRPERLLSECRELLRPGGAVVISLPNVANFVVRLQLLFGRFEYTERGILDNTHLRFFTRKTARRFLRENGYRILEEKSTVIPLDLALGLRAGGRLHRVLNRSMAWITRLLPGLFGYQMMFLAKPDTATPWVE